MIQELGLCVEGPVFCALGFVLMALGCTTAQILGLRVRAYGSGLGAISGQGREIYEEYPAPVQKCFI